MTLQVDAVIAKYLRLREKKERIENEVKEQTQQLKDAMEKIEAWLYSHMDKQGTTSLSAKGVGTAFFNQTDYANVGDWDATLEYIKANDKFELLERRVSKKAVRDIIDEDKMVPPGINYGTRVTVQVRKAKPTGDD